MNIPIREYAARLNNDFDIRFIFGAQALKGDPATAPQEDIVEAVHNQLVSQAADGHKAVRFALSVLCMPETSKKDAGRWKPRLEQIVKKADLLDMPVVGGHSVQGNSGFYILIAVDIHPHQASRKTGMRSRIPPLAPPRFLHHRLDLCGSAQGCAAKYPPDQFAEIHRHVLSQRTLDNFSDMRVNDDAVCCRLDKHTAACFTVDIIKPIVRSASLFGRIAVAHAANDLLAKGVGPKGGIEILSDDLRTGGETLKEIGWGGREEMTRRLKAVCLGSYELESRDLFYGTLFYGLCSYRDFIPNSNPKENDVLILTKPLGSGVLSRYAALKAFGLSRKEKNACALMLAHMLHPSAKMAEILRDSAGVHACTDISGFGLIGHLKEMLEPAGLSARLWLPRIPFLPCAIEAYPKAVFCSVNRNMGHFSACVHSAISAHGPETTAKMSLLYDAQTAGGFLVAVSKRQANKILKEFLKLGSPAHIIGKVVRKKTWCIEVSDQYPCPRTPSERERSTWA